MCFLGLSLEKVHTGTHVTPKSKVKIIIIIIQGAEKEVGGKKGEKTNQNNKPVTLYAN